MATSDDTRQPHYWIIVGSIDNFRKSAELGFTLQGIKSRHRKKAERMEPGDKLIYYVTGVKAFGGVATVTSPNFESHERIWTSGDPKKVAEDYPFRVEIRPDVILPEDGFVPAEGIARQMTYAAKWPSANWTLAFQGNVHEIGEGDYALIRNAIEQRAPAGATAGADGRGGTG
jgi:EVE domain-containing protein